MIKSVYDHILSLKDYDGTTIIHLWSNEYRVVDIISVDHDCKHDSVSDNICSNCGAFVGIIGDERGKDSYMSYVKNMIHVTNMLRKPVVVSNKYVPEYLNGYKSPLGFTSFNKNRRTTYLYKYGLYVTEFFDKSTPSSYVLSISPLKLKSIMRGFNGVYINPTKEILLSGLNFDFLISNIKMEGFNDPFKV